MFNSRFLTADVAGAKADLEESLKLVPSLTQSWVKLASIFMEQGDAEKTFDCFEEALKHNNKDPDIFYHRGQGKAIVTAPLDVPLIPVA